jgi:hypothetical protein
MKCLIGLPLLIKIELLWRSRSFKNREVGVGSSKNLGVGVRSFKNRGVGVVAFAHRLHSLECNCQSFKIFALLRCYAPLIGCFWRFRAPWTAWPLTMGLISCPEISATNYQSTLRNIPKQQIPHLQLRLVTINSMTYLYSVPFAHVRSTTVDCLMYKFGNISIAHSATFVQLSRKNTDLWGKVFSSSRVYWILIHNVSVRNIFRSHNYLASTARNASRNACGFLREVGIQTILSKCKMMARQVF